MDQQPVNKIIDRIKNLSQNISRDRFKDLYEYIRPSAVQAFKQRGPNYAARNAKYRRFYNIHVHYLYQYEL